MAKFSPSFRRASWIYVAANNFKFSERFEEGPFSEENSGRVDGELLSGVEFVSLDRDFIGAIEMTESIEEADLSGSEFNEYAVLFNGVKIGSPFQASVSGAGFVDGAIRIGIDSVRRVETLEDGNLDERCQVPGSFDLSVSELIRYDIGGAPDNGAMSISSGSTSATLELVGGGSVTISINGDDPVTFNPDTAAFDAAQAKAETCLEAVLDDDA